MNRSVLAPLAAVLAAAVAVGCAATRPAPEFTPVDLSAKARSGDYTRNVDNFLVILDASGSMNESAAGGEKVDIAVDIVDRLNRTVPDMGFVAGLRTFGNTMSPFTRKTDLIYGMTAHDRGELSEALEQIGWAGGLSPMAKAADTVSQDLKGLSGKTALIFVSDAKDMNAERTLATVRSLKDKMGDRVCIYSILVGSDPAGRSLMNRIADVGECGFAAEASQIAAPGAMADYVERVFLTRVDRPAPVDSDGDGVVDSEDRCPRTPAGVAVDRVGCPMDSDGDGVYDYQDRCPATPPGVPVNLYGCPLDSDGDGVADYIDACPDTPKWTKVDDRGCPVDSDGDGVTDDRDRCPGTPSGAKVNDYGCWVLSGVLFDTGKWSITEPMADELDQVARIMRRNPDLKIEIRGHTDSVGDAAFNQKLSEKRARAVMNYLVGEGISAKRLQAKGLGESRPVVTNDTPQGRAQNRRVELTPMP